MKDKMPKRNETMEEFEARHLGEIAREALICLCGDYANHILTPRLLADRRRRAGDTTASPSDYDCRCELSAADDLPFCEGRRADCKFAHRQRPSSQLFRDNKVWYAVHRAERERILRSLPVNDAEALSALIGRMDKALRKEHERRMRRTGSGIVRATNTWIA
jgi:CDGSH-type Zn-finger protein